MNVLQSHSNSIFSHEFTVPQNAVDQNGHVNNVVYVQWMQDVAVRHSDSVGGTKAMHESGSIWVVRSHKIEYFRPAYAGEEVVALTWVSSVRRARSMRRYKFYRKNDSTLLAKGETDWVFIDAQTGRPRKIPKTVLDVFTLVPKDEEPQQVNI